MNANGPACFSPRGRTATASIQITCRRRREDAAKVVVVGGQACQSADRGWRRVVVDGDGGGRGRVASNVPRGRRQHVRAVRCLSGIPGHGIGCRRDLRPKGVAVERELNACHPDVVRGCGGHNDRGTRYRGSVHWSGKRHDREESYRPRSRSCAAQSYVACRILRIHLVGVACQRKKAADRDAVHRRGRGVGRCLTGRPEGGHLNNCRLRRVCDDGGIRNPPSSR